MSESVRAFFESHFGHDFSKVRVHTGAQAAETARAVNAHAFTLDRDVVFGTGQYAPETTEGKRLLAHELTHAVQQGSAKINGSYHSVLQRFPEGATAIEAVVTPAEKKKVYLPVNWGIDHAKRRILAIPKAGVSLDEVAQFLYGSTSATTELASVNEISPTAPLVPGRPLRLTGKKLTSVAYNHLKASPKVPAGVRDPEAFLVKKKTLDNELEKDFNFIVNKLDESHYSDSDEGQVISILKKLGEEKTNPKMYPNGGEYLNKLFSKLTRKRKDVGIITTQWTNYYSLIFNHFDRVAEVKSICDRYSRLFTGESGLKELSFGSFFSKEVKEGTVRDQIFAYFKGLGKGVWSGAKGTVMMAYTLIIDPKKFISDLANLPGALKTLWGKEVNYGINSQMHHLKNRLR